MHFEQVVGAPPGDGADDPSPVAEDGANEQAAEKAELARRTKVEICHFFFCAATTASRVDAEEKAGNQAGVSEEKFWLLDTELTYANAVREVVLKAQAENLKETNDALKSTKDEADFASKFAMNQDALFALLELVINTPELKDSANSIASAWERILTRFTTMCQLNNWPMPPGGFKASQLMTMYNKERNFYLHYCRVVRHGDSNGVLSCTARALSLSGRCALNCASIMVYFKR